jgi:hypothetical protein
VRLWLLLLLLIRAPGTRLLLYLVSACAGPSGRWS